MRLAGVLLAGGVAAARGTPAAPPAPLVHHDPCGCRGFGVGSHSALEVSAVVNDAIDRQLIASAGYRAMGIE